MLERDGKNYRVVGKLRKPERFAGKSVVRLDGMIFILRTSDELRKFYWNKVGTFGRKKVRPDAPKFFLEDKEADETDLDRPFVKRWEEPLGPYA
ncbi:MAG: hypothetical protein K8F31_03500 [Roseovarius sp.]|nr:hypothetical protein [Roseovarius sp.]